MKLVQFPRKKDESTEINPVNAILDIARASDLKDAIVIGVDHEGLFYLSSNITSKSMLVMLLEQMKFDLLAGELDDD